MKRCASQNPGIALAVLLGFVLSTPMSIAKSSKDAPAATDSPGPGSTPTSSNMAVESTIFAYRALAKDADKMAEAINGRLKGRTDQSVVIATPAEFTSLVQWRIVMAQADLLHSRAQEAMGSLAKAIPIPPEIKNQTGNVEALGAGFVPSASDLQTVVQTVASIFAVNETLSISTGALTSTPLTNLLAARLRKSGPAVYVPASYIPNLLQRSNLDDTFIGKKVDQLEQDRTKLGEMAQEYLQALKYAETASSKSCSDQDTQCRKQREVGVNFKARSQETNQKLAAFKPNATAIVKAIDDFEATLFTGKPAAAPSPSDTTPGPKDKTAPDAASEDALGGPPAGPSAKPPKPGQHGGSKTGHGAASAGPPAGPSAKPAKPLTGAGPGALDTPDSKKPVPGEGDAKASPPADVNPSGSPLQQLLLPDLLAHQVWHGAEMPDEATLGRLHILIVQTLESGGAQLTKSRLFTGSRIYFNGGAVATFALYHVDGSLECGGFAYAYGGYTKDDDFPKTMNEGSPPIAVGESDCEP